MRKHTAAIQYSDVRAAEGKPKRTQPRHGHAVGAAGEARLVGEDDGEEEPETSRDREIMALEAQDRPADQNATSADTTAPAMKDSHDGTPRWVGPTATAQAPIP